ncbi:conjugal transfer ATP-binding protein TraC [Mesomycoplasma hyorhinis]|nr:conjugal transfer ATP-binding protein TraC [Mesomycoplasma hyorhinis]
MFNNHTTIDFLNNFTIIDTKTFVENNSIEFVNASFFLIIFLIQNKINKNFINNKKFILAIDELHKFIDSNNLTTLNFIFQTTKTIRKFNGSIVLSTQNINDFALSKDLINKTQAILKNMQYKFFLHLPGDDIKMINQIFNPLYNSENEETNLLNKFDSQFVLNAKRGQLLLLSSFNEKNFLRVNYNDYEKEVILN